MFQSALAERVPELRATAAEILVDGIRFQSALAERVPEPYPRQLAFDALAAAGRAGLWNGRTSVLFDLAYKPVFEGTLGEWTTRGLAPAVGVTVEIGALDALDHGARQSRSNRGSFRLQGVSGFVELSGDLTHAWPWLAALELRGAGQKRSFGLGQVRLWLPASDA